MSMTMSGLLHKASTPIVTNFIRPNAEHGTRNTEPFKLSNFKPFKLLITSTQTRPWYL